MIVSIMLEMNSGDWIKEFDYYIDQINKLSNF